MHDDMDKVRLDRWLWAARFFKTRALASDAIKHGQILLNGHKAKPARKIGCNDRLRIRKAQLIYEITVEALGEKRVSAKLAQQMYSEAAQSVEAREQRQIAIRADRQTLINGRPSKKDRRQQQAIKRDYND